MIAYVRKLLGLDDGGGNPNHDPNTGRFTSGSGGDSKATARQHDVVNAAKRGVMRISSAQKRHASQQDAAAATQQAFAKWEKSKTKAIAKGKQWNVPQPSPKGYFNNPQQAQQALKNSVGKIASGNYTPMFKNDGEVIMQVWLDNMTGMVYNASMKRYIPSKLVNVVWSANDGWHCYPKEESMYVEHNG